MYEKFKNFKKQFKKSLQRLPALLLCFVSCAACLFMPAASLPPARAASGAASVEASLEALALLYSLLSTAGTASGMEEGLKDYKKGDSLMDAFMDFALSATAGMAPPQEPAITVELADGTVAEVTLEELASVYNAQPKPDAGVSVDEAGEYVRMLFVAGLIAGGGEAPEPPEKKPSDAFTNIQKLSINAGTTIKMAEFFEKLQEGEIEGVEPEEYYGTWFDGTYERDADGNYIVNGTVSGVTDPSWGMVNYTVSGSVPFRPALFRENGCLYCMFPGDSGIATVTYPGELKYSWVRVGGGAAGEQSPYKCFGQPFTSCAFNIPVFQSREAAAAFLQGGDAASPAGMTNLQPYDFKSLVTALGQAIAPLAGTELTPEQMLNVNAAVSEAVQALPRPEPGSSPQQNASAYEQAVTDAVTEVLPEPAPEPVPENPKPSEESKTEAKKYRRDLTMIFPFCIPFDLIRFFDAMNAEPVAPVFHIPFVVEPLNINMDVELDMSFLEPAMEVFRLGQLGLFIIGLILVTGKVIKW